MIHYKDDGTVTITNPTDGTVLQYPDLSHFKDTKPNFYFGTLVVSDAPFGKGEMTCNECREAGFACIVSVLPQAAFRFPARAEYVVQHEYPVTMEESSFIHLNYSGTIAKGGRRIQPTGPCSSGTKVSLTCLDANDSGGDHETDSVPMILRAINTGIGAIAFSIMLQTFLQLFRHPFGSFRYYQQAMQLKRRMLMQGYLVFFAVCVVCYFLTLIVFTVWAQSAMESDQYARFYVHAFSIRMLLLFGACVSGLMKGFDFDKDWYLESEVRTHDEEGCCGRGCGCCFCGGTTHANELVDDVLLFDSVVDLIGASEKNVLLVESAAAAYWLTGRDETLRLMLRGSDNKDNIQRLCQQGGALARRMEAEANAAKKELEKVEVGGCCGGRCAEAAAKSEEKGRRVAVATAL